MVLVPQNVLVQKVSVRFEKIGRARFFSHHDMMRYVERALRRAELPVRLTEGFNPRPRIVFPHALGLGVASVCEEVEIELTSRVAEDELATRLQNALRPLLEPIRFTKLPPVRSGRTPKGCVYHLTGFPAETELAAICQTILSRENISVTRIKKRQQKTVDIRPYVESIEAEREGVFVSLRHLDSGAGRIDEIARLLAEEAGTQPDSIAMEKVEMILS